MEYQFLKSRGALHEGTADRSASAHSELAASEPMLSASLRRRRPVLADYGVEDLKTHRIPPDVFSLLSESVARENSVIVVHVDGESLVVAASDVDDLALADKLRFLTAHNVVLVEAPEDSIRAAIDRHYPSAGRASVDSMLMEFTDTSVRSAAIDDADYDGVASETLAEQSYAAAGKPTSFMRAKLGAVSSPPSPGRLGRRATPGLDVTSQSGDSGMFHFVVEEGQRVLMKQADGRMEIVVGPKKLWRSGREFRPMSHFVAHPGEFLIVQYRDGRQAHLPGPVDVWFDPREHKQITCEDALQVSGQEAVVVYCRDDETEHAITRRVVKGPALFVPDPGEWLHTFSWHSSKGGSQGAAKVANSLVFQKLWLMPDQMYHDVPDVRTSDDAVLTIRLMIFFELLDIEKMLDTTHDPIGDFVNAATSDAVEFVGRHDFESFKKHNDRLNDLDTYKQLTGRGSECGYRINKVVYRGYGAPETLQQMHNQAIEARTRLALEQANERQAQDLEDYKLQCQMSRASNRRSEQTSEVEHDLELTRKRQEAEIARRETEDAFRREQRRRQADQELEIVVRQDAQRREQFASLREMGVDLTAYLTQNRADRVIELRGSAAGAHVHLDRSETNGEPRSGG